MPRLRAPRTLTLTAAGLLALTACSGSSPEDVSEAPPPSTQSPTDDATDTAEPAPAIIATAAPDVVVAVHTEPDGPVDRELKPEDIVSVPGQIPLTFLVRETRDGWLEVHLPVRPNGSTGWIRADVVEVSTTAFRIEVEVAARTLTLFEGSDPVFEVPVGVGREDVPTPGGVYYLKELLQPPNPDGPYGVYAYGISGFSPVLDSFNGGDAVIGIHGTDDESSIGEEVSSGCIRLHNDDVARLVEDFQLPLGTPVEILA